MSYDAILEIPNVVIVRGAPGVLWRDEWVSGAHYKMHDGVFRGNSSYRAMVEHEASADTDPGVGANWETAWRPIALGYLAFAPGIPSLDFSETANSQYLPLP
ncbi:hypothetical protein [Mesorhizobium sp. M0522]|uniref:hypothetical protein n=1 Tax=Mesorhizobium sp. M0522 TaxID=2956958 RepID=UPI0033350389